MAIADGNKIHIFYTRNRPNHFYIRTGELNILDAKFHDISVKEVNDKISEAIERYVERTSAPEQFLELLGKESITWDDIVQTEAMPDFEEVLLKDGWIYSNIYNEVKDKRFLGIFKRKLYTTILHKEDSTREITSYKPIIDQSVLFLV